MDSIVAFYQQYRRQLATSIGVVMAMVIGLSLANGILFALEHWDDKAPVSIVAPAGNAVESPRKPASSIAKLNLFGDVQQSNVVVAAEAPETRLNLELQGVFIATVDSRFNRHRRGTEQRRRTLQHWRSTPWQRCT